MVAGAFQLADPCDGGDGARRMSARLPWSTMPSSAWAVVASTSTRVQVAYLCSSVQSSASSGVE